MEKFEGERDFTWVEIRVLEDRAHFKGMLIGVGACFLGALVAAMLIWGIVPVDPGYTLTIP